jgi:polygalacturonase
MTIFVFPLYGTLLLICFAKATLSNSRCRYGVQQSTIVLFDVTDYGAVGNGVHDDTETMRRVLQLPPQPSTESNDERGWSQRCCHKQRHILIPEGVTILSYPLNLTSCTILQVDGALVAMPSAQNWPIVPPVMTYGSSEDTFHGARIINQYHPFVYAVNASHLRITGKGTIHGSGQYWWNFVRNEKTAADSPLQWGGRPNLIQTVDCQDVEIDSITLIDSAFWTVHPLLSRNIFIHHVTIRSPMYAPNVDGIDPDSCRNVVVEYNDIACGDDHIAIKAGLCGWANDSRSINKCLDSTWQQQHSHFSTRNITIRHNVFRTGMGIAIGSESSGSIRDVYIYNNTIGYCPSGHDEPTSCGWGPALHLKTTTTRSGSIENIFFDNNTVYNTSAFILVETNYHNENQKYIPENYPKTLVRNIFFRYNRALGAATSAQFHCSALDPCYEIHVLNNTILNATNPWECQHIQSYHVQDNVPGGLEECMANSMNGTAMERRSGTTPPKQLWWKHLLPFNANAVPFQ